jgi:uncharacterized membrane protein YraQ (UPF0718 family)
MSGLKDWAMKQPVIFLIAFAIVWLLAYQQLPIWSQELVNLLPIAQDTRFHEALSFFLYDVPKILMLLVAITLVMGIINSYFSPEKNTYFACW